MKSPVRFDFWGLLTVNCGFLEFFVKLKCTFSSIFLILWYEIFDSEITFPSFDVTVILLQHISDDRHINNTGYCRYSVILGTKSALKHNNLQIYVRFVPDPIGSGAKNALASKKCHLIALIISARLMHLYPNLTSGYLDLVQRLEFGVDHLQKYVEYQIE